MYNYLLGAVATLSAFVGTAAAEDAKGSVAKSLDGTWTVVCFEKNGQPQADSKGMTVKSEAGTITCSGRDGKPAMTMKVVIGQNGTVQVTEVSNDTTNAATPARAGVYVLTADFLAISLNADAAPAGADRAANDTANKARCSIILKRDNAK